MSTEFEGREVVVTGAASGIGKQTALEFLKQGPKVSIGDVDDEIEEPFLEKSELYFLKPLK